MRGMGRRLEGQDPWEIDRGSKTRQAACCSNGKKQHYAASIQTENGCPAKGQKPGGGTKKAVIRGAAGAARDADSPPGGGAGIDEMALVVLLDEMRGAYNGKEENSPASNRMFLGGIIGGSGIILCVTKSSSPKSRHDG